MISKRTGVESLPGFVLVFDGLMSSSENKGSRTDMGLGRSSLSVQVLGLSTFPVTEGLEGDLGGEDKEPFPLLKSWNMKGNFVIFTVRRLKEHK